jgi:predicted ATPase with chaperone activity
MQRTTPDCSFIVASALSLLLSFIFRNCIFDIVFRFVLKTYHYLSNTSANEAKKYGVDFADVRSQENFKRALAVATVMGNIITGSPGESKQFLQKAYKQLFLLLPLKISVSPQ